MVYKKTQYQKEKVEREVEESRLKVEEERREEAKKIREEDRDLDAKIRQNKIKSILINRRIVMAAIAAKRG